MKQKTPDPWERLTPCHICGNEYRINDMWHSSDGLFTHTCEDCAGENKRRNET
jgi:hypothetical protein